MVDLVLGGGGNVEVQSPTVNVEMGAPENRIVVNPSMGFSITRIAQLKVWAKDVDTLVTGAVTVDANDLVTSAVVEWPDGTPGVLTIDARQAGTDAVTQYHVTYVGSTSLTFTQPGITRNANGAATAVPQLVVT